MIRISPKNTFYFNGDATPSRHHSQIFKNHFHRSRSSNLRLLFPTSSLFLHLQLFITSFKHNTSNSCWYHSGCKYSFDSEVEHGFTERMEGKYDFLQMSFEIILTNQILFFQKGWKYHITGGRRERNRQGSHVG